MDSNIRLGSERVNGNSRAAVLVVAILSLAAPLWAEEIRVTKDSAAETRVCLEVEGRADLCWTVGQLRAADPLRLRAEALRSKAAAAQAEARLTDAALNSEMLALQADVAAVFGPDYVFDFNAMKPVKKPPVEPETKP